MSFAAATIPGTLAEIDDAWLAEALGLPGVRRVAAAPLGNGHLADTYRIDLEGAPWPAVVAKLTAQDAGSRATAVRHRSYAVEVGFYRDAARDLPVRVPTCHWAGCDESGERYALIIEHITDALPGDQIAGCDTAQAEAALEELALLHAPRWGDETLRELPWIERHGPGYREANAARGRDALPRFMERFGDRLDGDVADLITRFAGGMARFDRRGQDGVRTIVHGDLRADNIMFGPARACLVDWQTVLLGHGLVDVSYFLGTSLEIEARRAQEDALLRRYHERLCEQGVALTWEDCWTAYRRYTLEGLAMVLIAAPNVKRHERGDELFVGWAQRAARQALDLEAERLMG